MAMEPEKRTCLLVRTRKIQERSKYLDILDRILDHSCICHFKTKKYKHHQGKEIQQCITLFSDASSRILALLRWKST